MYNKIELQFSNFFYKYNNKLIFIGYFLQFFIISPLLILKSGAYITTKNFLNLNFMYKASLRDRKKRKYGIRLELKKTFIKSISYAGFVKLDIRIACIKLLSKYRRYTSFVQYNNFCNVTDKSRSVFRFFGIERFILRQNILKGSLNYIKYRITR